MSRESKNKKSGRLTASNAILFSLDGHWRVLMVNTLLGEIYHVEHRTPLYGRQWRLQAVSQDRKFAMDWFATFVVGGVVKQEPVLLDNL